MGINITCWQENLRQILRESGIAAEIRAIANNSLLVFADYPQLVLNLISIHNDLAADKLVKLQQEYQARDILLVHLWEDVWLTKGSQVLSRITSMIGINKTVHGRKTQVISITQPEADDFLAKFHLQASARARHRYALMLNDEMVAVATFSAKRNMTRNKEGYTSVELIRFATANGLTVQGGLSKLISHLVHIVKPSDIMTYADMDWSYGKVYNRLGFKLTEQLPPSDLWLDTENMQRYFPHRLPQVLQDILENLDAVQTKQELASLNYYPIFNSGNLKYILYL